MADVPLCAFTPAQRRHSRRIIWASLAYAALLIPVVYIVRHEHVVGALRILLALLPAVPLVGMFVSYGRYLSEETDEYVRSLVIQQILSATTVAMTVAVVWGLLSDLGGAPRI